MKHNAKQITKAVLSIVCLVAILVTGMEDANGAPGIWNLIGLAVAGLSGWGLAKLEGAL